MQRSGKAVPVGNNFVVAAGSRPRLAGSVQNAEQTELANSSGCASGKGSASRFRMLRPSKFPTVVTPQAALKKSGNRCRGGCRFRIFPKRRSGPLRLRESASRLAAKAPPSTCISRSEPGACLVDRAREKRVVRCATRRWSAGDQLGIVVEHFFEMRHQPASSTRVAGETAADMIVDAAAADAFERSE